MMIIKTRQVRLFFLLPALLSILLYGCGKKLKPLSEDAENALFYVNPSPINNIGDPFIMKDIDGSYYCYATSSARGFLAWRSADLVNWEDLGLVFNAFGKNQWADADFWAPEVVFHGGKYYMFYSGRWIGNKGFRVGAAVSDSPAGPFVDALGRPLFDFGYYAIDAHVFFDDDRRAYLYFSRDLSKNITNRLNQSHVYGVELAEDLLSVSGDPVLLLRPEQEWETLGGFRVNEGPFMLKHEGAYYLMYSGNSFDRKDYSVGYALSANPLGPFVKYADNPLLTALFQWDHVSGTGHNCVTVSPDGTELLTVYHTHTDTIKRGGDRQMAYDRLGWREDGTLYISGPSVSKTARPSGSGPWSNIAASARISASSSPEKLDSLRDGAVGFLPQFSGYDWTAAGEDTAPRITLSWDEPVSVSAVMVYSGAGSARSPFSWSVSFEGDTLIQGEKDLKFPRIPGAASILSFEEIKIRSITINLHSLEDSRNGFRLSEILVLSGPAVLF